MLLSAIIPMDKVEDVSMADKLTAGRTGRIIVGVVLPCPIAALAVTALFAVVERSGWVFVFMFPLFLFTAYYMGGLQFALHSAVMEFAVWPAFGLSCVSILASALLGLVCGYSVFLIMRGFLPICLFAGFVAGLVTGLVLCWLRKRANKAVAPNAHD
jgi:hypothetical protein